MDKEYKVNTIVMMKKPHPCGNSLFQITRTGVDIKIKCSKCGRSIMLSRVDFDKRIKKIMEE